MSCYQLCQKADQEFGDRGRVAPGGAPTDPDRCGLCAVGEHRWRAFAGIAWSANPIIGEATLRLESTNVGLVHAGKAVPKGVICLLSALRFHTIGMDIALEALREVIRERRCTIDELWNYAKIYY